MLPYPKEEAKEPYRGEPGVDMVHLQHEGPLQDGQVCGGVPRPEGLGQNCQSKVLEVEHQGGWECYSSWNLIVEKVAIWGLQLLETAAKFPDDNTFIEGSDLDEKEESAENIERLQTDLNQREEDQSKEQVKLLVGKLMMRLLKKWLILRI